MLFAVVMVVAGMAPAVGGSSSQGIGSAPAGYTPWLLASTPGQYVRELAQCGDTMYAVGTISAIGQGSSRYTRSNAFSFSVTTGAVTSWAPQVDGQVDAIALSPDCHTAYLGGQFTSVNEVPVHNLVAVDAVTGEVRGGFAHDAGAEVYTLLYTHDMLLAGGAFHSINGKSQVALASLDPETGEPSAYADLAFAGGYYDNPWTKVANMQVSHGGGRLLVEGVFSSIEGWPRQQVAILGFGTSGLVVEPWHPVEFNRACHRSFYVHDAAWSPNDRTVYIAATGVRPLKGPGSERKAPRAGLCDAASAFPVRPHVVRHRWVNYTGCDSLYAVVADARTVYITGHERWASNPDGCDAAGSGAIPRPGIGALTSKTGAVKAWNPTRSRGYGGVQLLLTAQGLWIASDNFKGGSQMCGGENYHGGICLFPRG